MYRTRFWAVYCLLGWFLITAVGVGLSAYVVRGSHRPVQTLPLITDDTGPAGVDAHFKGDGYSTGPASSLGAKDGTCWVYGNHVSWMIIKCFGDMSSP